MSYDIHITRTSERDLLNAADYIEFVLKNSKAGDDLLNEEKLCIFIIHRAILIFFCPLRRAFSCSKIHFTELYPPFLQSRLFSR